MAVNDPNPAPEKAIGSGGKSLRNFSIVLAAVILSVALFLGLRTETTSVSSLALAKKSVPLEVAIANGKPTLMEFYADWCTSCQAMAGELQQLKQEYGNQVNFVMLNVDNSKWLPEILQYRVDGIPHFVFLGVDGEEIASAIGEIPRSIMEENLESLVADLPLPYAEATGQTSVFSSPVAPAKTEATDPRSHGSQVKRS